jgi:hypothetical protein
MARRRWLGLCLLELTAAFACSTRQESEPRLYDPGRPRLVVALAGAAAQVNGIAGGWGAGGEAGATLVDEPQEVEDCA